MELDKEGLFDPSHGPQKTTEEEEVKGSKGPGTEDWKARYLMFLRQMLEFRFPYEGREIVTVDSADEVAYCKCKLRSDVPLGEGAGVYLEVEVAKNTDNLSLALVDFDEGGKSSVTFSPDTGAVIKEKKIQESPRRVKGAYIEPLEPKLDRFEGKMGLYVRNGHIAFFRKYKQKESESEDEPWESTGFVIDLSWADGKRLTPCLAFRDEGPYCVHVVRVDSCPPIQPEKMVAAYLEKNWSELNWEGGQPMPNPDEV